MKKLLSVILIASLYLTSCNVATNLPPSCQACIDSLLPQILDSLARQSDAPEGLKAAARPFYFVSDLYTDESYAIGQEKYKGLKDPQRFWLTIKTDREAFNPKFPFAMTLAEAKHEIEEAFHCMFKNYTANLPLTTPCYGEDVYDYVFGQSQVWGIYIYATPTAQKEILPTIKSETRAAIQSELDSGGYRWKIVADQSTYPPSKTMLQQIKIQ